MIWWWIMLAVYVLGVHTPPSWGTVSREHWCRCSALHWCSGEAASGWSPSLQEALGKLQHSGDVAFLDLSEWRESVNRLLLFSSLADCAAVTPQRGGTFYHANTLYFILPNLVYLQGEQICFHNLNITMINGSLTPSCYLFRLPVFATGEWENWANCRSSQKWDRIWQNWVEWVNVWIGSEVSALWVTPTLFAGQCPIYNQPTKHHSR